MAIVCVSKFIMVVVDFFLVFVMAATDYLLGSKIGVVGFGWEKIAFLLETRSIDFGWEEVRFFGDWKWTRVEIEVELDWKIHYWRMLTLDGHFGSSIVISWSCYVDLCFHGRCHREVTDAGGSETQGHCRQVRGLAALRGEQKDEHRRREVVGGFWRWADNSKHRREEGRPRDWFGLRKREWNERWYTRFLFWFKTLINFFRFR